MPLDTRLQDVNRMLDPGIKTYPPDSSQFGIAYRASLERADRLRARQDEIDERAGAVNDLNRMIGPSEDDQVNVADPVGNVEPARKSPQEAMSEFTQLSPDDMYKKIGSMASMAATPSGARILGMLESMANRKANVEQNSIAKQTQLALAKKQAEFHAEALDAGVDITNAEELADYKRSKTSMETLKTIFDMSSKAGRDIGATPMPQGILNEYGRISDPSALTQWIQSAPRHDPTRLQSLTREEKWMIARDEAASRGDHVAAQDFQSLIDKAKLVRPQTGTTVTLPDGTVMTTGPVNDPTIGTRTKVQGEMLAIRKSLDTVDDILTNLRPQDVGVKGFVGSAMDNMLGQLGLGTPDLQRMDNRQKVDLLREGSLKLVSTDTGALSNRDRVFIQQVMPTLDPLKSHAHSMIMAKGLKGVFAKRALMDAKTAKIEAPDFAIKALDDAGLFEAVDLGILDQEKAKLEWQKRYKPAQ